MAKTKLRLSTLALGRGETAKSTKGTLTSSGTFISASEDDSGVLDIIEEKIARATRLPRTHGEAFNVFMRLARGMILIMMHSIQRNMANRKAKDLLQGGETMFPFENGAEMGMSYDHKKCIGLKIMPKQGDGLLFYSVFPNGTIDPTSLHGSCPVIKGEKWVATKWIRNQEDMDQELFHSERVVSFRKSCFWNW